MNSREYYASSAVRERIFEFLGGDSAETATCVFVAHGAVGHSRRIYPQPTRAIQSLLAKGLDIARSSWDRNSLLLHLDIEYVNFDDPAQPYLDHRRTFELQEPPIEALLQLLGQHGIHPLHMLSGRGHHLVWRVRRNTPVFDLLASIGHLPFGVEEYYRNNPALPGTNVEPNLARAYAGVGMLLEYVTDETIRAAGPDCPIPITISDVEVEPQLKGREVVSIDVSEYSDPLNTRMIRTAFSIYTKTVQFVTNGHQMEHLHFVPQSGMDVDTALSVMRSPELSSELARTASVSIPDYSAETEDLLHEYRISPLGAFHQFFYSEEQMRPTQWASTYDLTSAKELPGCVRALLEHPDKKLLRPAALQVIVRSLYALGWHPQHIAGIIRSKFERFDSSWGEEWKFYNPATRADFYARALSGAIATGVDRLEDFSCESFQRKGFHLHELPSCELSNLKESALQRILS